MKTEAPSPSTKVAAWDVAALGAVALFGILLCFRQISATDFWWQLKTGGHVLEHGWPRTDAFSYTAADSPWIELRWLYCVLLHALFGLGGAAAAILAKTAAVAMTLVIALRTTLTRRTLTAGALLVFVALLAMNNRLYVRPELVTSLFLALFLLAVHRDRKRRTRWIWALPAIQVVWVNSHTLFILGPAVVGAWVTSEAIEWAAAIWRGKQDDRRSRLTRSATILGCTIAACFVNPWLWNGALFPITELFKQLQGTDYSTHILELRPAKAFLTPNVAVPVFFVLLGLAIASAVGNLARLDLFWTICVTAFAYLALTAVRNVPLFVISSVSYVALNLRAEFLWKQSLARWRRGLQIGVAGALVVGSLVASWLLLTNRFTILQLDKNLFGLSVNRYFYPTEAVDYLDANGVAGQKVFNYLGPGSYLLYRDFRVFFDPRLEVYGEKQLEIYNQAVMNESAWGEVERRHGFPIAFIAPLGEGEISLVKRLRAGGRWRLAYLDQKVAVLLKEGFAPQVPAIDFVSDGARWTQRWRESLGEPVPRDEAGLFRPLVPSDPFLRLGLLLVRLDQPALAEPFVKDALGMNPRLYQALDAMAVICSRRGALEEALDYLTRAIECFPRAGTDESRRQRQSLRAKSRSLQRAISKIRALDNAGQRPK